MWISGPGAPCGGPGVQFVMRMRPRARVHTARGDDVWTGASVTGTGLIAVLARGAARGDGAGLRRKAAELT